MTLIGSGHTGITSSAVLRRVSAGRWRRLLPRVYLTAALELSEEQRIWAAVLYVGEGAAITGLAALAVARSACRRGESPKPVDIMLLGRATTVRAREFVRISAAANGLRSAAVDDVASRLRGAGRHRPPAARIVVRVF